MLGEFKPVMYYRIATMQGTPIMTSTRVEFDNNEFNLMKARLNDLIAGERPVLVIENKQFTIGPDRERKVAKVAKYPLCTSMARTLLCTAEAVFMPPKE